MYFCKIHGCINSKELYELIEHFGASVTDLGEETLVYGEADLLTATRVIFHAALFGDVSVELTHSRSTKEGSQ